MFGFGNKAEEITFTNNLNMMNELMILTQEIEDFNGSEERAWMIAGEQYYKVKNDITGRVMYKLQSDGSTVIDTAKANNKLAHGFAKLLIDEKISYLLGKQYSLTSGAGNEQWLETVKDVLGRRFQYILSRLGYEAAQKGLSWGQPYIDEKGNFKIMMIPTEQCVPIWTDNNHTELEGMIRYYTQIVYVGTEKQEVTKVEYWTAEGLMYYELVEGRLIEDIGRLMELGYSRDFGGTVPHYTKGGESKAWGRVPFVCFKNNMIEYPDIRFIKGLVDEYDKSRSDVANFLEECKNLIYVLKNYGGQDLGEFMSDLNYYRAIKVDDDGAVDTLTPTLDIAAAKEHFERTKADIIEFGQGTTKDLDKFGAAPSGIALKFLYSGLDLKCNQLEVEFQEAFKQLLYFVNIYCTEKGLGSLEPEDIDIIFNRDILINETEAVTNCQNSAGIISAETIAANHPWVTDLKDEMKRLEKEKKAAADLQKETFGMNVDNGGKAAPEPEGDGEKTAEE